ncbi:MAG: response regulator [Clostridium perfringens]|nr:response regulator [Clostridium perfringens]
MVKVLIVEDDPMVALINRRYLEEIGNVKIFGPVMKEDEIISIVNSENIDLILLDVFLPKKNGLDILKTLRSKKILVDVIMITAANSVEELKKAFAYGVVDYLVKPFEFPRFEEAFNKYKTKKSILNGERNLEQSDIDNIYLKATAVQEGLPKGLNERTLNKVIEFLENNCNKIWTLREISNEIGISNVTIKKYMDYLESINKISVELTCGNVGRPELKYSII